MYARAASVVSAEPGDRDAHQRSAGGQRGDAAGRRRGVYSVRGRIGSERGIGVEDDRGLLIDRRGIGQARFGLDCVLDEAVAVRDALCLRIQETIENALRRLAAHRIKRRESATQETGLDVEIKEDDDFKRRAVWVLICNCLLVLRETGGHRDSKRPDPKELSWKVSN